MSNNFIAPHPDDEGLFGSYIIQRTNPIVYVVTDGNSHERFGVSVEDRRKESIRACKVLGVEIIFLGILETELNEQNLREALLFLIDPDIAPGKIFIPALEGGNPHHDLISRVAGDMAGDRAMYYGTYKKDRLYPAGEMEIIPTHKEEVGKELALSCYTSQIRINVPHFD
jgi:LmbE family N-acetylglucosaminyl deacetylase